MAQFSVKEILKATNGENINVDNIIFSSVETDTRNLTPGALFVALKGENFDGHNFIEQAIRNGATAVMVSDNISCDIPCIKVVDTLKAYQNIANFHRNRFSIPIVAITGSSGKTTTKELIATVVESKYNVLKTEKNYNNEVGVPLTLLKLNESHEACIIEMGMRGYGQIKELTEIAEPTIGVITNVSTSHIELLGSQMGIARAKAELVEGIPKNGYVILNQDDEYVSSMAEMTRAKTVNYGLNQNATITGFNVHYKKDGIKFTCRYYDDVFDVFLPMIGEHNVYNALTAIAVGRILGISTAKIRKALNEFKGIKMRQEIKSFSDFVLVNDTYNANPSSMKESIMALGQLDGKRKIAILGDMLELGDFSAEEHYKIGELLGKAGYEILLTYGKESKKIAEGAKASGVNLVKEFKTHKEIAEFYLSQCKKDDSILLKGSRGMMMEKVAEKLQKMVQ